MSGAIGLPKFDHPPVYETVLGVQFEPLKSFSMVHFGLLWQNIQGDYPKFEVHPPINPTIEQFGANALQESAAKLELVRVPDVRTWFLNESGTILLQVQRDRFLQNWRKMSDGDEYPHYDQLKPKFFKEWQGFCKFVEESGIENPDVNQCEVTYINHIDIEQGPRSYRDLGKIISCWSGEYSGNFLGDPESVSFNSRYLLPEKKGRLHISMQPAIRRKDAKEILRVSITARGRPVSSELHDIEDWFDLGHEWIVRGFADITTGEMHKHWRRTQ